ncbi:MULTISPECIES: glycosyltransferase family 4 protein [Staphylococcaceae]|uniref:glycosyltransferase family 4 protein n=1 Tax=Staphylococcaceae TaxID=90964 RepID=UPI0019519766|nr:MULTISPECIES: glycosyltransferase family 4 protein [Staphylococcaceae]MCE4950837.1 glycosyltransferase family 4 protein [Staphylococcus hominis]MCE4953101.1 glycosyltransferase family 4 protein [Staphylococcus hominis]MEB8131384.1 glycosyltransferase family 4 protein [Mammaliicoccus sciuri]
MRIIQVTAIDMTMNNFLNPLNKVTKEKGHEVHCVCSKGPYEEEIKSNGYYFHNISIDREINFVKNIKSIMIMVKLFKILKPDIVHVHTPVAAVLGRIAAKIAKVPTIIYSAHGFYFHEGMPSKKYKLFFNIEKYIGRYFTDYIFTQSEEDFEVAKVNNFLKNKNNYVHISNGIDIDNKFNVDKLPKSINTSLRDKYGIQKNDVVVSFIGRLVKEKGILDLLESINYLNAQNVKFLIIGSLPQGERDTETLKLLEEYKNNKNIIFTGQVTNVNELLYMSDIFCLPSYREGMPRSIIEAMAMKNAVIATNIRGSREEVIHGKTGYLCNTNSSKEIASCIDDLVENKDKMNEFKENGLDRARRLYDENKVIEKQLNVFEQCQNKRK